MLHGHNLSYTHPDGCDLFTDISVTIQAGEVVGLPGTSGVGKSTLGQLLAGYLRPTTGKIVCDKKPLPLHGYSPVQLIFQHPEHAVNPRWTIRKILAEANTEYLDAMDQLELPHYWLKKYPHELSGGELQRISIIRIMNENTKYIIADEITASLDASTQALIWSSLLTWAKQREVGILAISHDAPLLKRICDRVDESFIR